MGGLGVGDLGIIFGNPGGGKSWMLVNIGAEAVKRGYTVCHYTLELSEYYVGKRYDALFTGIDVQSVQKNRQTVEDTVSKIKGKLIIKEFPMGKATTHTIESHIQKCRDLGYPPDLVIIDYVDLLKSKTKSIDPKDAIDDVYTPHPAYGILKNSNSPWIVPSSPYIPWNVGNAKSIVIVFAPNLFCSFSSNFFCDVCTSNNNGVCFLSVDS
jgi:nucleoside-triphosphatase THEP1